MKVVCVTQSLRRSAPPCFTAPCGSKGLFAFGNLHTASEIRSPGGMCIFRRGWRRKRERGTSLPGVRPPPVSAAPINLRQGFWGKYGPVRPGPSAAGSCRSGPADFLRLKMCVFSIECGIVNVRRPVFRRCVPEKFFLLCETVSAAGCVAPAGSHISLIWKEK